MKTYVRLRFNCIERVHFFEPELVPLTPKETTLFAGITATWTTLRSWFVQQGSGNRDFREGAMARRLIIRQLRSSCREIADMAKSIELEGVEPGISERFRIPRSPAYAVTIATAQGFTAAADPIKVLFTDRGLAATFIDDIDALIADFDAAGGTRYGGLTDQTAGTAGMEVLAAAGLKLVQQLRPIVSAKLKNQPAMLAAWKLAARVARRVAEEPATPPAPEPPGSGT